MDKKERQELRQREIDEQTKRKQKLDQFNKDYDILNNYHKRRGTLNQDDLRLEVAVFAEEMERKLRKNEHKGWWEECSLEYLFERLSEELEELRDIVFKEKEKSANTLDYEEQLLKPVIYADRIREEAADVANFAMMIADVCRLHFENET